MTLEQWAELPEDEPGELVDGCLTKEEAPDPAHEMAVAWIITLVALEIFQRATEGRYTRVLAATAGRIDQVPGCTGLVVDLDELWRELDRLAPE